MVEKLTRRQVLKLFALTAGSTLLACSNLKTKKPSFFNEQVEEALAKEGMAQDGYEVFLPSVELKTQTPPVPDSRVVHVHDTNATNWNLSSSNYWSYVNQGAIDSMVDEGVKLLTGTSNIVNAWNSILPNYQHGQGIAIKVNFNNSKSCSDVDDQIDAIAEPVNAIIRGLKSIGVLETDIWVYDAMRWIPDRFTQRMLYPGIRLFDRGCNEAVSFDSNDPDAEVQFSVPVEDTVKITDLLINATYLINVPIMKMHSIAGVSLGFKHHFGTISHPMYLHDFIGVHSPDSMTDLQCIVDLNLNKHIADKTILTVGDGIFACFKTDGKPEAWSTFDNQVPNSLFFSKDPLAVDCVMYDLLDAEKWLPSRAEDYLVLAGDAGLGVYERGDPWGSGYTEIDYHKIEL